MYAFPWIPIYKELARKLLEYRDRQEDLIDLLQELLKAGHKVVLLTDKAESEETVPLSVMEPFTFFACFNLTSNEKNRSAILHFLKEQFHLSSPVPESFNGIPIIIPRASRFFGNTYDRQAGDIDALWNIASHAINAQDASEMPTTLIDDCLRIRSVGLAKLTMGLFWLNPELFLPLDANTKAYLTDRNIRAGVNSGSQYISLLATVRSQLAISFPQISYEAYKQIMSPAIDREKLTWAVEATLRPYLMDHHGLDIENVEGYQHKRLIPEVQPLLSPESIRKDARAAIKGALLHPSNNLTAHQELTAAGNFLEKADPDKLQEVLLDLLYGNDALEERLVRFLEWSNPPHHNGNTLFGINATVASYLLAMVDPVHYAFCKPTVYADATNALTGHTPFDEHDPVRRCLHANAFYADCLKIFRDEFRLPFSDLMHVHIAFYLMSSINKGSQLKWSDYGKIPPPPPPPVFTIEDALKGLFLDRPTFEGWLHALRDKKNVILQGPPGVGKTFVAKRLAYALMEECASDRLGMVQFHQAYAYEDFVQGFRPSESGGFLRKNGHFFSFCDKASKDKGKIYVFIIDEINRGNLSKIFGELMMLIESDKRGRDWAIPLAYATDGESPFYVPENVYLIGLMNTADRSLAMVDYALRRRFRFLTVGPGFQSEHFATHLKSNNVPEKVIDAVISRLLVLNEAIRRDATNLGPGFQIGHSYFCGLSGPQAGQEYHRIIQQEIAPLLHEYWFDQPEQAQKHVDSLLIDDLAG